MEGRAIAVSEVVTLPNQPAVGEVGYVPLGGDGYTAPFAAHTVKGMALTGDASAGSAIIKVTLDPRFCALVAFVTAGIQQGTSADADIALFFTGNTIPTLAEAGPVVAVSSLVSSREVQKVFNPVPLVVPGGGENGNFFLSYKNVLNDVFLLDAQIYLFNIRVRELTPMGPLLWARGST